MTKRERIAALKLAAILEEFTAQEIANAAEMLTESDSVPESLEHLLRGVVHKRKPRSSSHQTTGQVRGSKAVQRIRESEPQRYEMFAAFEAKLRNSELLDDLNSLRELASDVGIEPTRGARRADIISRLMAKLVELPHDRSAEIVSAYSSQRRRRDGYMDLANYLYKGNRSEPEGEA